MKKINLWPLMVFALLMWGIVMAVWTITTVEHTEIVNSDDYLKDYRDVDYNINDIMASQSEFGRGYEIKIANEKLLPGEHTLNVQVVKKGTNDNFKDAIVTAKISRYETNTQNVTLDMFSVEDESYVSQPFETKLAGRYIISVSAKVGKLEGFKTFYVYVDGTISDKRDNQRELLNKS